MSEEHDSWIANPIIGVNVGNFIDGAIDTVESTASSAVETVENTASSVVQDVKDAAPGATEQLEDAAKTYVDFETGVAEGAWTGVKDLAGVAQTAADMMDGVALTKGVTKLAQAAVDEDARKELVKDVEDDCNKAEAVASFGANLVVDPSGTGEKIGKQLSADYDRAAASGHGAEFIGKGVGQAAVIVGTSLVGAGEVEAAGLVGEGAEVAGAGAELTAAVGEGGAGVAGTAGEAGVAAEDASKAGGEGAKLFENLTEEEVDAAVEDAEAGTRFELPVQDPKTGKGLVDVETRFDEGARIPHHDNMTFEGIKDAPPGEQVEVRRHSANANAPEGSYSRDNPTTQIDSIEPAKPNETKAMKQQRLANQRYRLPDGTYKRFSEMTDAEKAAAHIE